MHRSTERTMDRVLILSVDRDDDLGKKAGVKGPVVGRRDVLTAALKLGIADPEESDTNAILGALNHYDAMRAELDGKGEVEIALLTGEERVGVRSDRVIAAQLESVVGAFQPDSAILVTDGAEDESVLPILRSQVRVDAVRKIIVKQSKGIEGTYYYIMKALEDEKWRSRMLVPLAFALIVFGLGIMLPNSAGRVLLGGLPLTMGLWALSRGLGIENSVQNVLEAMRQNADAAMFSTLLWVVTVFSAIFAVVQAITQYNFHSSVTTGLQLALLVTQDTLIWVIITFVSSAGGFLLLRWRRGSFSGGAVVLGMFGMAVYNVTSALIVITLDAIESGSYEFSPTNILDDALEPVIWIGLLWVTVTVVRALRLRKDTQDAYWGV